MVAVSDNITRVKQSGFVFNIRIDRAFQDISIINEVIAGDTYEIMELAEFCKAPELIMDIGGHIGTFGIFAKSLWPKARIIAVEPDEMNAKLYRMNLKDNFPEDTDSLVINKAIAYNPDKKFFLKAIRTTGGNFVTSSDKVADFITNEPIRLDDIFCKKVETTTIEEIIEEYGIKRIDLAKWDCEGAEIDAFRAMPLETKRKFRFMVGEVHVDRNINCQSFFAFQRIWPQIKRWFPMHFFDWTLIDGTQDRTIFKAFPK